MRDTCGYLERRISSKIREMRIREIEVFGFRKLPTHVSTLQEGGNSSYLVYFPSLGQEKMVFRLRACLAKKKNWIFGFCSMFLHLGEDGNLLREDWFFS